ncbi:secondary thiamine-phosphate synthase enzyme YjbQ [Temperatibacter marinus]|uniref:Secondary thiamine-phosphate synthase enzyme YjbQ n=1 Tax=Temperatibacter marinus TaxID=1456591 RepID=A0AA52EJF4_9PROT|nr:secondary thiamine-phosphate synthase enzyme YjbQ [Temperatibacter marinus]WND03389.1 secondary thiamine-phosphate synthase enzyme YjbQ [Temperatibacter marinus]
MKQFQKRFQVKTHGQELVDLTALCENFVAEGGMTTGQLTLFIQHTSASLTIQENADPTVQSDLVRAFHRLAPEDDRLYDHTMEGSDDMPAHIKSALTNVSLTIPISEGRLILGTWQGVYLFEHRKSPHHRHIFCHLIGT